MFKEYKGTNFDKKLYYCDNDSRARKLNSFEILAAKKVRINIWTVDRVADPVWYWPDPDPTSQDKPDPDPNPTSQDKPDPDPDTYVLKIFHLFYDEF